MGIKSFPYGYQKLSLWVSKAFLMGIVRDLFLFPSDGAIDWGDFPPEGGVNATDAGDFLREAGTSFELVFWEEVRVLKPVTCLGNGMSDPNFFVGVALEVVIGDGSGVLSVDHFK